MGRNKSFDELEVLDRAANHFWRHGYAGTTVRDLEGVMGLSSASLYNSFGDKRALFRRALQRYLDRTSRISAEFLRDSHDPRAAIEIFLCDIVEASTSDRHGCFLINSAAEISEDDAELRKDVAGGLREVEDALRHAVGQGQSSGSIPLHLEASSFARCLLGTVVAVRIMCRTGASHASLQTLVDSQIALMTPPVVNPA